MVFSRGLARPIADFGMRIADFQVALLWFEFAVPVKTSAFSDISRSC